MKSLNRFRLTVITPRRYLRSFRWGRRIILTTVGLPALLMLNGCTRAAVPSPESVFREIRPPEISDDLDFIGLLEAIEAQRSVLKQASDQQMRFGPVVVSRREYANALDELASVLKSTTVQEERRAFIRNRFRFFEYYGGKRWGEILLTSYYEPVIQGSIVRTPKHSHPLYAKPSDLVTINLKDFSDRFKGENPLKGRLLEGAVVPYYTRAEIDGEGVLRNKHLELCWVDPIEAFFLHIQGSGTVRLDDGKDLFMTYADKNGRRYEAVGKFLKERIAPHKVTMQRVEAALRHMSPQERDQVLFKNPSYVFFNSSAQRAITAIGVPATPGRTIAADPKFAPKGALALLSFSKPIVDPNSPTTSDPIGATEAHRIVIDQDSGGAITGTDRIDLFWGRGPEAKRYAGIIQHPARIVYLVPR